MKISKNEQIDSLTKQSKKVTIFYPTMGRDVKAAVLFAERLYPNCKIIRIITADDLAWGHLHSSDWESSENYNQISWAFHFIENLQIIYKYFHDIEIKFNQEFSKNEAKLLRLLKENNSEKELRFDIYPHYIELRGKTKFSDKKIILKLYIENYKNEIKNWMKWYTKLDILYFRHCDPSDAIYDLLDVKNKPTYIYEENYNTESPSITKQMEKFGVDWYEIIQTEKFVKYIGPNGIRQKRISTTNKDLILDEEDLRLTDFTGKYIIYQSFDEVIKDAIKISEYAINLWRSK